MNSSTIYKRLNYLKSKLIKLPVINNNPRVGAMILSNKGKILALGFNSYLKSHPIMQFNNYYDQFKIYIHAEMDACIKSRLVDHSFNIIKSPNIMIVARVNNKGQFRLAKPCSGCQRNIVNKFSMVYYTNSNGILELL